MQHRRGVLAGLIAAATSISTSGRAQERPFRILSIDGGGIKGIVPATILRELDVRLAAAGKPGVARAFDMYAGTSTGCIIAAGLACSSVASRYGLRSYASPAEIVKMYRERGQKIFEPHLALRERLLRNPLDWWGQSYSAQGKLEVFSEAFGVVRLANLESNFLGTFYSMGPGGTGAVLACGGPAFSRAGHTEHGNLLLRDVVHASSSAPIYFNPVEIGEPRRKAVDGGVFANNPAAAAYFAAATVIDGRPIEIVSIGCGASAISYPSRASWGPVEWVSPRNGVPLVAMMSDSQSSNVDQQLRLFLKDRYQRFQPALSLPPGLGRIDDASRANLDALERAAMAFVASEGRRLDALVQRLG